MQHRYVYYRVSTAGQSIEAQRSAMGTDFDGEFIDEGVSGAVMAADRPEFARMLGKLRAGDTVHVYAVDRLGRDALDVQATVRRLIDSGVTVDVRGLGQIGRGVGELILAVLAQVADMERLKIAERTADGRDKARKALAETGQTHRGKSRLGGRAPSQDAATVAKWRRDNAASIKDTATRFDLSVATVKRYCSQATAA